MSFHPRCIETGHHQWSRWTPGVYRADGVPVKGDFHGSNKDTYECPRGEEDKFYFYRRACWISGCDAVQYAERLEPSGRQELIDTHSSDEMQARWAAAHEMEKATLRPIAGLTYSQEQEQKKEKK